MQTIIFDKTGTLTEGKPTVTDILANDEKQVLTLAASIEQASEHPLSRAVVAKAKEEKLELSDVEGFEALVGRGIAGKLGDTLIRIGNVELMEEHGIQVSQARRKELARLSDQGKTPLLVAQDEKLLGIIAVAIRFARDEQALELGAWVASCSRGLRTARRLHELVLLYFGQLPIRGKAMLPLQEGMVAWSEMATMPRPAKAVRASLSACRCGQRRRVCVCAPHTWGVNRLINFPGAMRKSIRTSSGVLLQCGSSIGTGVLRFFGVLAQPMFAASPVDVRVCWCHAWADRFM